MNFLKSTSNKDKELFFGPIDPTDIFIEIQNHWTMAHIMKEAGFFPSISQARKNGWDKPIPEGFNEIIVGKKRKKFGFLMKKCLTEKKKYVYIIKKHFIIHKEKHNVHDQNRNNRYPSGNGSSRSQFSG